MSDEKTRATGNPKIRTDIQEIVGVTYPSAQQAPDKTGTNVTVGYNIESTIVRATYNSSWNGRAMMVNVEYDAARSKRRLENLRANRAFSQIANTSGID